jgi:hypothetical protein
LRDEQDFELVSRQFMAMQNSQPIEDFEGLSASQMAQSLSGIDGFDGFMLQRQQTLDPVDLCQVPLVAMFHALAEELGEKGMKLTPKGRLPRKVVLALYGAKRALVADERFDFHPRLEDESAAVYAARAIFQELRLLRVIKGRVALTALGKRLAPVASAQRLFWMIFEFTARNFNWGYTDLYEADPHIQHSFVFSLWLLKKNQSWQPFSQFLARYHRAFPMLSESCLLALRLRMTRVWQWMGVLEVKFDEDSRDYRGQNDVLMLTRLGRALYG